jgi:peptide/nickel transport system substrate-binding protein
VGERKTEKILILVLLGSMLLISSLLLPAHSASPLIKNPYDLYEATIEGAEPQAVDPARAYDTASEEIIFNVYDTLLTYDGERVDTFLPSIASSWRVDNITGTKSPEGLSWYYRYVFTIRQGITFQPPFNYTLTAEDVEYSFEREMVQDATGGPQWMLYEPLLDNGGGAAALGNGNLTDTANVQLVGKMIDHAVESDPNGTVWFNLAFPGAYAPFMQILCQTWGSILSKQWINNYVIATLGRSDWSGDWSKSRVGWNVDHTEWIDHHDPADSPLDKPTPLMYGSGPFILQTLDFTNQYWELTRNAAYWRGWPADWPAPPYPSEPSGLKPAGYVSSFKVTWAYDWNTAKTMFLNGDLDFVTVPRQHISEVLGQDGTRCMYQLPSLSADALFFTFNINATTSFGPILSAGTFNESGIPSDFFGNPTWGVHVRRAFAYAFDYDTYIAEAYPNSTGQHPTTAIIPGLPYYDPTVKGYVYNLTRAAEEFEAVPGLWNTGFTITLVYVVSGLPRPSYAPSLLKKAIESLNPRFHVTTTYATFMTYFTAASMRQLPTFALGWLADYPDPHDFAYAFYHSRGILGTWQLYYNPVMDNLVDAGLRELDPTVRATIYHNIQVLAIEDCPNIMLDQGLGYHFERDWICGWYYNPAYPGIYAYNLWKWYYIPHALANNSTQPTSNYLPADVNYDGKTDMKDIGYVARSFGASYGPPLNPRWIFRCDVNNDRKIEMKDIGLLAKQFGRTSPTWNPPP